MTFDIDWGEARTRRLSDLRVGVGTEPDIRWGRILMQAHTCACIRMRLHQNAPLQLGQKNVARCVYVEMRKML